MDCELIQDNLVVFHLGHCTPELRHRMQAHLGQCPACLASYWELKEAMDFATGNEVRPSPITRRRLTSQWTSLFGAEQAARQLAATMRRSPVASFVLAAAVAAFVLLLVRQRIEPVPASAPTAVERIQDPLMQRDARTMTL